MSDIKRIIGIAKTQDGESVTVEKTERERDDEIIDDWEMRMMLSWACEERGMVLLEVQDISYV